MALTQSVPGLARTVRGASLRGRPMDMADVDALQLATGRVRPVGRTPDALDTANTVNVHGRSNRSHVAKCVMRPCLTSASAVMCRVLDSAFTMFETGAGASGTRAVSRMNPGSMRS